MPSSSDSITGEIRPILLILLAGSVILLLIACVNIASLLLVRAEIRRREMAVRGALGASFARLTRQLVMEAALLVVLSVSFGLPTAWGAVELLAALIPERVLRGMPFFQTIGVDHRVLFFAAAVSLVSLAVCTVAPMSRLSITDLSAGLAKGARSSSGVWRRSGSNLVVVELTLAIVLLAAAGLLGKSFYRILHVDLNFKPPTSPRLRSTPIPGTTLRPGSSRSLAASWKRFPPCPAFNLRESSASFPSIATAAQSLSCAGAAHGVALSRWPGSVP